MLPKIRAMEIINELEPSSRGIYGGAIGYISWSGNIDTAIAIRTAIIKDKVMHVGAGAGIVADSIPENEWHECKHKSKVFIDAIKNDPMILVIDNYDSFTYNLVHYLGQCGQETIVKRNDEISIDEIKDLNISKIVISPDHARQMKQVFLLSSFKQQRFRF